MQGTPYSFFVQWHLTERCNLKCRHCYQRKQALELGFEAVRRGLDNITTALNGWASEYDLKLAPACHFTGGEPLFRKDLFDVLDYARGKGFSLSLMTNGTMVTPLVAHRLRDAGVTDVQVSLDGLEKVHDSIRGQGSFRKAVKGIQNLVAAGVDTFINLTVSRLNTGEIEGVVELAGELGVTTVSMGRLVPCGRGEELAAQMLTTDELNHVYNLISESHSKEGVNLNSIEPLAALARREETAPESDFPSGGCAAGFSGITVASDGSLMPCRRMDLVIGNITTDSFRQVWAESPVLTALRTRTAYHEGCDTCANWAVCRGCRAIALSYARSQGREDYLGPDPQCPFTQPPSH